MGKKKKIKKFDKILQKYQENKEIVKLATEVTDGEASVYCVILDMSNDFMHLSEKYNFQFDGEAIMRLDYYDTIRCDEVDMTTKFIMEAEKQLTKNKPKKTALDITSWKSIFSDLKEKDIHVIIECDQLKDPTFTIGAIEKIKGKSATIWNYDATGLLGKKPIKVKYKDISMVKFNDSYSTTFRKYLLKPKKKNDIVNS